MAVTQISVFVENKPGKTYQITKALGENGINFITLSIADTTEFGILRCIVDDTEKALDVLRNSGFTANAVEVLAVEINDRPNGLATVLKSLDDNGISIEYLYSYERAAENKAYIMFKVENEKLAEEVLKKQNFELLDDAGIRKK